LFPFLGLSLVVLLQDAGRGRDVGRVQLVLLLLKPVRDQEALPLAEVTDEADLEALELEET
jgi:hypothetical protein